jgi:guanine deaminase
LRWAWALIRFFDMAARDFESGGRARCVTIAQAIQQILGRLMCPNQVLRMSNAFMARAIELSLRNVEQGLGGPFGAVVVKDGEIIAEGANSVTTTNDPTAHAEVIAIREACKKLGYFELNGCEIYTSCEPCPMCLGAIYWARPDRVYYGNTADDAAQVGFDDSFIYTELGHAHDGRRIPMISLMREEALGAFRAWAKKSDRIHY